MLFRVSWNKQQTNLICLSILITCLLDNVWILQEKLDVIHFWELKLCWPKVLLKSYVGKRFNQKLPWLKVLLKIICRSLIVIQILNNYYTKYFISDIFSNK